MLKNLFFVSLKAFAVFGLLANFSNANANNPWEQRFYGGLSLGGASLNTQNNLSVRSSQISKKTNDTNVHGELIGGYEISNQNIFLALETDIGLSSAATEELLTLAGIQHPFTIESKNGFGFAAHIGKSIDENHRVYLKLGIEIKKFQTELKGLNRFTDHKKSFNGIGFVPGIGIEKKLTDTVNFRTEYKVSLYSAKKLVSEHTTHTIKTVTHHLTAGFYFKT